MTPRTRSRAALLGRAAAPPLLVIAAAALLLRFPPTQYSFYPQCPIHRFFGVLCPGCGATRALAALLHGHLDEALRFNSLLVCALPFAAAWSAITYIRFIAGKPLPTPPSPALYASLAAMLAFAIARNL
jgi:Protein of unknown function (DUF2752)